MSLKSFKELKELSSRRGYVKATINQQVGKDIISFLIERYIGTDSQDMNEVQIIKVDVKKEDIGIFEMYLFQMKGVSYTLFQRNELIITLYPKKYISFEDWKKDMQHE